MKKSGLLLTTLLIAISAMLFSCESPDNPPQPCESHVDENENLICDLCKEELPKPTPCAHADADGNFKCDICDTQLPKPCNPHIDANKNLICDVCKEELPAPSECETHIDANKNLVCDICQKELPAPLECETHIDANKNLVCDICKKELPNPALCAHADTDNNFKCDICDTQLPNPATCAHTDTDENFECDVCKSFVDEKSTGWLLEGIPGYNGGILATEIYIAGQGYEIAQPLANENLMQAVSETTAMEFITYLAKLEKAGYTREFYREADTNLFASYIKGAVRVYSYFMARTGEVRIVKENATISASLLDFGYSYQKETGEQSVVYQFALPMNDETHTKADGYKDNGMLYIIKLADNSVVIIDGGAYAQFPTERRTALLNMLYDITGTKEGEKIRIAAWFITHPHGDHYGGIKRFFDSNHNKLDLERVFFGLPSINSSNQKFTDEAASINSITTVINERFGDDNPKFLRLHTGQVFNLADVSFEVLYTHEDGVDAATGISYISDVNDTSSVIRITIDGETFIVLGDLNKPSGETNLIANWSAGYLKSDCVQIAHHVMNPVQNLYNIIQAEVLLVPQSRYGIEISEKREAIFAAASSYARENMIFYQNEATVGIAVKNGKWEVVYNQTYTY